MKFSAFLMSLVVIFALGCGGNQQQQEPQQEEKAAQQTMEQTTQQGGVQVDISQLASTKCPVCGMDLTKHMVMDTARYEGKLYGFCSAEDREKFMSDPAKYMQQHQEMMKGMMEGGHMEGGHMEGHEHKMGEGEGHEHKMGENEHKMKTGTKEEAKENVQY